MGIKSADASLFQTAVLSAAKNLEAKKEWINELNVFPVPDGDTGTNMTMTIMAAAREVAAIEEPSMGSIAKALSSGSLRGARGNSGVILSQLFRGFTKEIAGEDTITVTVLANAFTRAAETAYKAVMKPKEGTILTVARGMAEKAVELAAETDDIVEFLEKVIEHGDYVLSQTPEMLPVLKQAGVVDSGGQGLMQVMKGGLDGLLGRGIPFDAQVETGGYTGSAAAGREEIDTADIKFGYCTEFIINVEKEYGEKEENSFKGYLESLGDCVVVVSDEDVVKVHVHTNNPGLAIERALTYGSLSRMKIDNMREEHHERLIQNAEKAAAAEREEQKKKEEPRKPYGFIAVSIGEGLGEIFKGIGADYLIEGGQTMNPSTEDMLNAIDKVNADVIYILPNNKNIIMASEQAQKLADRKVIVLPTRTVPQGMTAMLNFDPELKPEENAVGMMQAADHVSTGLITYAARDSEFDGKPIKKGEIMALENGKIVATGTDIVKMTYRLARSMKKKDSQFITVISGCDVSDEDAEKTTEMVRTKCGSSVEVSHISGGQPVYYYMISVE